MSSDPDDWGANGWGGDDDRTILIWALLKIKIAQIKIKKGA